MSQMNPLFDLSLIAGADLSALRYRAVKSDGTTAKQVIATAAAADRVIGVLQNKPDALGKFADVAVHGTTKWEAGAAVTVWDYVKLDPANGRCITGGGGSDVNWGIALEAATAAGDLIEVLLLQPSITT